MKMQIPLRFLFLGKTPNNHKKTSPSKSSPVKKSPTKNNPKPPSSLKPVKSPVKSVKTSSSVESSTENASPKKKEPAFTTFSENVLSEEEKSAVAEEDSSELKSEGIDLIID